MSGSSANLAEAIKEGGPGVVFPRATPSVAHAVLARLPIGLRYRIWRALVRRSASRDVLADRERRIVRSLQAMEPFLQVGDKPRLAVQNSDAYIENRALLLSVLPTLARPPADGPIRLEDPALLRGRDSRPMILLGTHYGPTTAALAVISALRHPIHMIVAKSISVSVGVQLQEAQRGLGAREQAPPDRIRTIEVPDSGAAARCLAALRRNETIHVTIDTRMGDMTTAARLMGAAMPVPVHLYRMARRANAELFSFEVSPPRRDAGGRLFHGVTLAPLPVPEPASFVDFHQALLDSLMARIRQAPHCWMLWHRWD